MLCGSEGFLNSHQSALLRLAPEEGDGVIERLFKRVEGTFDLQAQPMFPRTNGFMPFGGFEGLF